MSNTLIRYVAIGGTAYILELLCIYLFVGFFHDRVIAVGISFWIGLIVSFLLQKIIAFRNSERTPHILTKQVLAFSLLVVVNYIFTLVVIGLISEITGLFIARTIALVITTCWNFLIYNKLIFKN